VLRSVGLSATRWIIRLQCHPWEREDPSVDRREETAVPGVESRDFESPDETRTPDKTQVDVVRMGATTAARMTFEPGWRWSDCVRPVAGTESCQARHVGVVHSGRLAVKHEDGTEVEIGPGEAYVIEPGHDAWVVGDERFVGFEFEPRAAEEYAKG
jgi:mannose-6-phosphate isomerase-like protein (cupin superfamily)